MSLIDPSFLKRLEMLFLLSKRVLGGSLRADRKSDKKGSGINFADYSEYNFGDDYRSIDWNIYARLETLVVKLFELEEDVSVDIIVDVSHSMQSKLLYTKKIAAALAYIGLNNMDRVSVFAMADKLELIQEPIHGKARVFGLLKKLEEYKTYGQNTDFNKCIKTFKLMRKGRGICVVISDFLFPDGYESGLNQIRWSKNDMFCLQILSPEEMVCDMKGDVEIQCNESKALKKVTVSPKEKKLYENAIKAWNENLKKECARKEIGYAFASSDVPFEDIIQMILRRGGLVA